MLKLSKSFIPIILFLLCMVISSNPIVGFSSDDNIAINDTLHRKDTIAQIIPRLSQIHVKNETINVDETWSGNILVTRSIIVSKGATLTILPGTVVKFKHYRGYKDPEARLSIFVVGTIKALGAPLQQIWFTSDAEPPINGDWDGIYMNGTTDSIFNYTIVEYGLVGIVQYYSESIVANSIIRWANTEGLYAEYSNVEYVNNMLYGNGYHEIALEQFNTSHQGSFMW